MSAAMLILTVGGLVLIGAMIREEFFQ